MMLWRLCSPHSTGRLLFAGSKCYPQARFFSGIDTVVENQVKAWLEQGGERDLSNKGSKIVGDDKHRYMASALGVGDDYVHSKILADNNFKPESIQRRLELDKSWQALQAEILLKYEKHKLTMTVKEFSESDMAEELFHDAIQELDRKAKRVNEAIICDSLRFNGRSPVPHARRFRLQERIAEALEED